MVEESLTGWGRTPRSVSHMRRVGSGDQIDLEDGPRGNLARGLGRAYGDAALNAGGTVWDVSDFDFVEIDPSQGVIRAGAGASYDALLKACLASGYFTPVTPGTKWVTIGGAIAADVHGKNHHRDGSIRRHVVSLTLLTGDGEIRRVTPGHELFEASLGGMGLTGMILESTLRLLPVGSRTMVVETIRTDDLDATLAALSEADNRHRYTVAWVDLTSRGRALGRGLVDAGDHATTELVARPPHARHLRLAAPPGLPFSLINRASVAAFNQTWYRRMPRRQTHLRSIDSFFYPLDAVDNWNRLYGKRGFIQYQFVIPDGSETVLVRLMEILQSSSTPALAVLKRFGEGSGLLSFPIRGWTLAVDMPASRGGLAGVLDESDRRVAEAGGRVYLAKDARMRPEHVPIMYPDLDKWRNIANKYDPERRFRSDLDRRLRLRSGQ